VRPRLARYAAAGVLLLTVAGVAHATPIASETGPPNGLSVQGDRITPPHTPKWLRGALKARECILYRESRGNYRSRNHVAFGAYQLIRSSWDITAEREGLTRLIGVRPDRASRADQDRIYFAAWKHGNGRFYWSARWGAPYACYPNDTKPMRASGCTDYEKKGN